MRHSQAGAAIRLARTGAFALFLAAVAAVTSTVPAMAADYKAEYKLSTVVGEAFPWGFGGKRWVIWFIAAMTTALLLVMSIPDLVLWLPHRLGY